MSTATSLPPWPQRWAAYFNERFKIGLNLFATLLMVVMAAKAGSLSSIALFVPWTSPRLYLITAVFFLVFLHLRVFDEHKDYAIDSVRFPERVLSKGWVTLPELRRIAEVVIPLELVLAYGVGMPFFWATLAVIAYSFLMLKEFFVADWLKRHMVLYGVSHMAIIPLMVLAALVGFQGAFEGLDPYRPFSTPLLLFCAMYFFYVYSLEIARKIRPPELEKPDVDTYSKLIGIPGAIVAVVVTQAVGLALLWFTGLPFTNLVFGVIAAAQGTTAAALLTIARKPAADKLAKLDNIAAGPFLVMQLTLIIYWNWII